MNRAKSIAEVLHSKRKVLDFAGRWNKSFGCPELTGSWLIWGGSGCGKTRLALQLCKYLAGFARVAYNSLEEGAGFSIKKAFVDLRMQEVSRRFILLDQEPVLDMILRLKKQKSPDVIAIDSLQYSGLDYKKYKDLRDAFPRKLFIFISHSDGKNPGGRVAKSIRFDAFVKIYVEGYRAFVTSRYGGGVPFTIWEEGARRYGIEN